MMELSDALKAKLDRAETDEEFIHICAEEGIEITLEQLNEAKAQQGEELSEDSLDNVSGGVALLLGIAAAAAAYYVYKREKERIERENKNRKRR